MSTVIRSCPGCKSLILADTDQCPECGHVFYQRRKSEPTVVLSAPSDSMKSASIHEPCPHCGEMVRSGLVRCWSCNGFMRADVAARYKDMTSNPQKIIYSTIPIDERTDYLPARSENGAGSGNVYDADEFTLSDDFSLPVAPEAKPAAAVAPAPKAPIAPDGPDKPQSTTPNEKTQKENTPSNGAAAKVSSDASAKSEAASDSKDAKVSTSPASRKEGPVDPDDLLSIAMAEQREVKKRRGEKLAERQRKQMLVPCSCGAWVRVHEEQSGKTVRCRQCKQPIVIPEIRKKTEKKDDKPAAPTLDVTWVNDVWFHLLNPTSLVLKPGSLVDKHTESDIALTADGLHIVTYGGAKQKKSLFGGGDKKGGRDAQRKAVRDHIASTGSLKNLPDAEVRTIDASKLNEMRLVQPVTKVQESMFAGVPVFGEGRIAIFLPLDAGDGQQSYCSLPISGWRTLGGRLKTLYQVNLPAAENGVPEVDKSDTMSCFVNQSKVESIRNLIFYQKDPGYEMELSGYRCKACGIVVSEEGRKKNKLGGANGKGIAKAKCPKCSGKMGEEPLYRIKKSPDAASPAAEG